MVIGIGSYGLFEPHEGHFAGVGREMFLSGDWVTPHLNGSPYLNKPPLFYWMIATSYTLFGISEFAARLPQALVGWTGILLAWQWARRIVGRESRAGGGWDFGCLRGWYLFSHQLIIDEMLCLLHLASLYFLWKGVARPERASGWIWFYVTLGLSIMAKGLVGFVFPVAVFAVFIVCKKDFFRIRFRDSDMRVFFKVNLGLLRKCRPLWGLLVVVAIVAPWLILRRIAQSGVSPLRARQRALEPALRQARSAGLQRVENRRHWFSADRRNLACTMDFFSAADCLVRRKEFISPAQTRALHG